jgi:hypothetical protein
MGDRQIFLKTGRDASFNKDLSNEPSRGIKLCCVTDHPGVAQAAIEQAVVEQAHQLFQIKTSSEGDPAFQAHAEFAPKNFYSMLSVHLKKL